MELYEIRKGMCEVISQNISYTIRSTPYDSTLHERMIDLAKRYNALLEPVGETEFLNIRQVEVLHIEISDLIFEVLGFPRNVAV
jgi:hypothetical protein